VARRILICLAFATWCFLNTWVEYAEGGVAYFTRRYPLQAVVFPVLWIELLLAAGLFGAWEFCRRRRLERAPALHLLFLALSLAPLGIASVAALRALPFNLAPAIRNRWFWPVALVLAAVPVGVACRRPLRATWIAKGLLLYSWPVLLLVLVQACRATLLRYPPSAFADKPLAAPLGPPPAKTRVVWIIFDELSQTIAFGNRPAGLRLPNFDRRLIQRRRKNVD